MTAPTDHELLRDYAKTRSEQSFRTLVERHIHLVHAAAWRRTGCAHQAQDVTQAVFIALADKAATIPERTHIVGWLFQSTQFAVANLQRAELRRKHWENKAATMDTPTASDSSHPHLEAHLDRALDKLGTKDRLAILLKFFENKSHQEIGRQLGITEDAAKMRLSRALERLRLIFQKQGMAVPTLTLIGVLAAQGAHAAPAALTTTAVSAALLHQQTTTSLTLLQILKTMFLQQQIKSVAILTGSLLLMAGSFHALQSSATGNEKPADTKTTPIKDQATTPPVLVFRDTPSWNRDPDFEDILTDKGVEHDVFNGTHIPKTRLEGYQTIIIPGGQWHSEVYKQFTANAARFDRFVTNGGTLILELNGAETAGLPLPLGVRMMRHDGFENTVLLTNHPVMKAYGKPLIRANLASHGYLTSVPANAFVLATASKDGQPDRTKPTFVEYTLGSGRVIAACQCFHDRDGSSRGPMMEAVLRYAEERKWFRP